MAPTILVIAFFQLVVLQQPIPNGERVLVGLALVMLGVTFFIQGLQIGLFPIGETMPTPRYAAAHRWRYARVITAADADAPRISASGRIALAGDWLAGARIEDAWLSGRMAIERLAAVAV